MEKNNSIFELLHSAQTCVPFAQIAYSEINHYAVDVFSDLEFIKISFIASQFIKATSRRKLPSVLLILFEPNQGVHDFKVTAV